MLCALGIGNTQARRARPEGDSVTCSFAAPAVAQGAGAAHVLSRPLYPGIAQPSVVRFTLSLVGLSSLP